MRTMGKRSICFACVCVLLFGVLQGIPICKAIAEQTGSGATGVYVKGPLMGNADDQEDETAANDLQMPTDENAKAPTDENAIVTTNVSGALPHTGDEVIGVAFVIWGLLLGAGSIVATCAYFARMRARQSQQTAFASSARNAGNSSVSFKAAERGSAVPSARMLSRKSK